MQPEQQILFSIASMHQVALEREDHDLAQSAEACFRVALDELAELGRQDQIDDFASIFPDLPQMISTR